MKPIISRRIFSLLLCSAVIFPVQLVAGKGKTSRDYAALGVGFSLNTYALSNDSMTHNQILAGRNDLETSYTGATAHSFLDLYPVNWLIMTAFGEAGFWYYKYPRPGEKFPDLYRIRMGFMPGIAIWGIGNSTAMTIQGGITYAWMKFGSHDAFGSGYAIALGWLMGTHDNTWLRFGIGIDRDFAKDGKFQIGSSSVRLILEFIIN